MEDHLVQAWPEFPVQTELATDDASLHLELCDDGGQLLHYDFEAGHELQLL